MKQKTIRHLLASLAFLGTGTIAFAQTPAASPALFMDPHPYQSQIAIRSNGPGLNYGMVQVMPSVLVNQYTYHIPGVSAPAVAHNTALLYDKRNPLPATVAAGADYTFYQGGYMSTISADGLFNYKGLTSFKPAVIGGVWFTDQGTNNLVLVDSYGYYFNTFTPAPSIRLAGGNFFIDQSGVMTTMKSMGVAPGNAVGMATVKTGLDFSTARLPGGNFLLMADGTIVTVSSITGYVSAPYTPDSRVRLLGGNYFVGMDNLLYTIDSDGNLKKNADFVINGNPSIKGYSFMRFDNGTFIFIDGVGIPHRSILHVSSTGTTVENLTTLPATIDPSSIYLPRN
jgi:hypothetical protein